jgi:GntR family transcriptional regulator
LNALTGRIHLDFRSEAPLYMQMMQQIEILVKNGVLKPGAQLPTVRELAIELRVNYSTIARVYRILDEQKLISTQRGRGTYIWEDVSEKTMYQLKKKTLEDLTRTYRDEVARLGYSLDEAIAELKHIYPSGVQSAPEDTNETK